MNHHHPLLIIVATLGLLGLHIDHAKSEEKLDASTSDTVITGPGDVGCTSLQESDRLLYLLRRDSEAGYEYYKTRSDIGSCKILDKGARISLEKQDELNGESKNVDKTWYCVRPAGDPECYWLRLRSVFSITSP